jgi:hypothetical protein
MGSILGGLVERLERSGGGCSLPFRNEFFICVLILKKKVKTEKISSYCLTSLFLWN